MKSIADRCNPSLPGSVLRGVEAWQHLEACILTPQMLDVISSDFGGGRIQPSPRAITFLIGWAQEVDFSSSFDPVGHLQLVSALATWIKVKAKAGELQHFDWKLL